MCSDTQLHARKNTSQNKFRHFEVADNERYQQVWDMHAEESAALVEKMLQADEIEVLSSRVSSANAAIR